MDMHLTFAAIAIVIFFLFLCCVFYDCFIKKTPSTKSIYQIRREADIASAEANARKQYRREVLDVTTQIYCSSLRNWPEDKRSDLISASINGAIALIYETNKKVKDAK